MQSKQYKVVAQKQSFKTTCLFPHSLFSKKAESNIVQAVQEQEKITASLSQKNQLLHDAFPMICRSVFKKHASRGLVMSCSAKKPFILVNHNTVLTDDMIFVDASMYKDSLVKSLPVLKTGGNEMVACAAECKHFVMRHGASFFKNNEVTWHDETRITIKPVDRKEIVFIAHSSSSFVDPSMRAMCDYIYHEVEQRNSLCKKPKWYSADMRFAHQMVLCAQKRESV